MGPTLRIALCEARRHWQQRHIRWLLIVVAALSSISSPLALRDFELGRDRYGVRLQEQVAAQLALKAPLMGWAVEPTLQLARPPTVAVLWIGTAESSTPTSVDFGPAGAVWSTEAAAELGWLAPRSLDLELLLRLLGGLMAVMFGVEAAVQAKFDGTLRSWVSLPVAPDRIVFGIAVGSALPSAAVYVVVALAAWAPLAALDPPVARQFATAAVVALGPSILYLSWFSLLGANLGFRLSAKTAVVSAMSVWFAAALAFPQLITWAAQVSFPSPDRSVMERSRDDKYADVVRDGELRIGAAVASWAAGTTLGDVDAAIAAHRDEIVQRWSEVSLSARQVAEESERAWREARQDRSDLARLLTFADPAALFTDVLASVVGGGRIESKAWEEAVEERQRQLNDALFDRRRRLTLRVPSEQGRWNVPFDQHAGVRFTEVPPIVMRGATLRQELSDLLVSLVGLAAWLIVTAGLLRGTNASERM